MDELGYHLTFRAEDSRVLAPDVAAQRRVADVLHTVGEGYGLLAFRAAGDHLHVAAACDRTAAGKLARTVAGQLTRSLGLPGFLPAHFTPFRDQRHLQEVFFYILRNAEKHGVLTPTLPRPHLPTLTRHAPTRNAADGHIGPPTA